VSEALGEVLRNARKAADLSLREVERASKGKLSNGHLSLLESGEVKQPSPHHLYLLAAILKLDYARLLKLAGYVVPGEGSASANAENAALIAKTSDFSAGELDELNNYVEYIRTRRPKSR
jgi:transcriptional regulator with XRE-family HTH domain